MMSVHHDRAARRSTSREVTTRDAATAAPCTARPRGTTRPAPALQLAFPDVQDDRRGRREPTVEICAGAFGLGLGILQAGFAPGSYYDIDPHACATLRANLGVWASGVHEGDIRRVGWKPGTGRIDLLAAGTDCRPFSLAGLQAGQHDPRNLFPQLVRALRGMEPLALLSENVPNLVGRSFRPYFDYVVRQIADPFLVARVGEIWWRHDERLKAHAAEPGFRPLYDVRWRVVNAADYGVPQYRKRVIVVATRADAGIAPYRFPAATHGKATLLRD